MSRGSELAFNLQGTPGGKVDIKIDGAQGSFFLDEVRSGEYSGIYTIRRNDHIMPSSTVIANLRVDQRVSSYNLRQPLVALVGALLVTAGYLLLPDSGDAVDLPASVVWDFRIRSLGVLALLYACLGAVFGLLTERAERPVAVGSLV